MASTYRYAVKVSKAARPKHLIPLWRHWCDGCGTRSGLWLTLGDAADSARRHAADCEDLHRANWDAACPSCKAFWKVSPACPCCLGRGWVA